MNKYTGRPRLSLSELQALNTDVKLASDRIQREALEAEEYRQDIADYELEISISLTPDEVDTEMARFYPNVIGNGHPDVCLCPVCAPGEYDYYDETPVATTPATTPVIVPDTDDLSDHPF